jgi:hypothetical protein
MDTGAYIEPKEIMMYAAGMAGDTEFKAIPRGFYKTIVQDAFRELNMHTLFLDARVDYKMPQNLVVELPDDCVDVTDVYVFNGDRCVISNSRKVYWKRNYFTNGNGYIANNKGNNHGDPFMGSTSSLPQDNNMIRVGDSTSTSGILFYEIESGQLRVSSSCRSAGAKLHVKYKSSGGDLMDAPVIPLFFKKAIQDYVISEALLFRMANEPSRIRDLSQLQRRYEMALDKNGMDGSWHSATMLARRTTSSKMDELKTYLGRAAWSNGR